MPNFVLEYHERIFELNKFFSIWFHMNLLEWRVGIKGVFWLLAKATQAETCVFRALLVLRAFCYSTPDLSISLNQLHRLDFADACCQERWVGALHTTLGLWVRPSLLHYNIRPCVFIMGIALLLCRAWLCTLSLHDYRVVTLIHIHSTLCGAAIMTF